MAQITPSHDAAPSLPNWRDIKVPDYIQREYLQGLSDPLTQAFVHGTVLGRLMGTGLDHIPTFMNLRDVDRAQLLEQVLWMIDQRFPLVTVTNQASDFTGEPAQVREFNRTVVAFLVRYCWTNAEGVLPHLKEVTLAYGRAGYFDAKDPSVLPGLFSRPCNTLECVIDQKCGPVAGALIELGADTSLLPALLVRPHGRPHIQPRDFTSYLDYLQEKDPATWRHLNEALMRRTVAANAAPIPPADAPALNPQALRRRATL